MLRTRVTRVETPLPDEASHPPTAPLPAEDMTGETRPLTEAEPPLSRHFHLLLEDCPSNDDVDHDDDGDHFSEDADNPDDSFHLFNGHKDPILTAACSPTIEILVATGVKMIWCFCGALWVRWHPRENLVLAGSEDSTVWLWNADKATHLNIFFGHEGSVTCGDFTPDGKTISTASNDTSLRIWNPKTGSKIHVVKGYPYHTEAITCLTISYDSNLAITGSEGSSVHMVHIATGKGQITQSHSGDLGQVPQVISSLLTHLGSVMCVGLSPSVPLLATGSMDENLIIWDMQNSIARFTCIHEVGVSCLAWLGKSQYIATGCVDGKVLVWDSLSGNCVKIFNGHLHNITSLSVSSNGKFLVSGSIDGNVCVFEIAEFH
ncbi:hypothetical protein IFM89_016903 [Coptis chinensis]|uniref:Angio-associated migratory cell protein n=1 Tax=Coptis chinensis TaxID=261450 RepID=A0A835I3P9_9MAGN|nr:hypothetical protein IFM89_016903 [Coptis chinensis]